MSRLTADTGVDVSQLAYLRHAAYWLFGDVLSYPDESTIEATSETARSVRLESDWAAALAFFGPWERFLIRVERLAPAQVNGLRETYIGLFGAGSFPQPVPLCESAYLDQTAMASGQLIADLEGEYASVGLSVSSSGAETPDHFAVEMEFVSMLCVQEAISWEEGDLPGVTECIRAETGFLQRHPYQWLPFMARAVAARNGSGLYALTMQAAWALVAHDVDFMAALASNLRATGRPRAGEGTS